MVWKTYPTPLQTESLRYSLAKGMSEVPDSVVKAVRSFPRVSPESASVFRESGCSLTASVDRKTSPPMPMVLAGLAAYIGCDPTSIPAFNGGNIYHGHIENTDRSIIKTVAAYAVVVGLATSHRKDFEFIPASTNNTYFENLFIMMGMVDVSTRRPNPLKLSCFRRFAVLNADHGMTLSTFVLLATASSLADPISCLISSLGAAYGPLHFGAPESAYRVVKDIGCAENVPSYIEDVKRGGRRLFGFGHRTYKVVDPRLGPIKDLLVELDAASNPLLKVAQEIEKVASADEYFKKRQLHANADFYGVFFFIAM